MSERSDKARSFELDATGYDRVRPSYPQAMFDDLMSLCALNSGDNVLEVGAGTGKATLDLLRRGLNVTAVEPGAEMLDVLRRNAGAGQALRVVQSDFEHFEPGARSFSLAAFATSFHWVKRPAGLEKLRACLRPGGQLAVFTNAHPLPLQGYFAQAQELYQKFAPEIAWDAKKLGQQRQAWLDESIRGAAAEMTEGGYFGSPLTRTYAWRQNYKTEEFLQLLDSYSDHKTLPDTVKSKLYGALRELLDRDGGEVTKEYLTILHVSARA